MKRVFLFLVVALVASEEPARSCGVPITSPPRLNKKNEVILEMDRSRFPAGFQEIFEAAVDIAALGWNRECSPPHTGPAAGYPAAARRPLLVPPHQAPGSSSLAVGQARVPISWKSGAAPHPSPCTVDGKSSFCYPLGAAIPVGTNDWKIEIYEKSGPVNQHGEPTGSTIGALQGGLVQMLMHELGHVLGLNHDTCLSSGLMAESYGLMMAASNQMPASGHCQTLEDIYKPPEPTENLSDLGETERCYALWSYCDPDYNAWPKIWSACSWIPELREGNYYAHQTEISLFNYECDFGEGVILGAGGEWEPSYQAYKSPALAVTTPFEILPNGNLKVSGWVWGRTYPLRQLAFLIDGYRASVLTLSMGLSTPGPCEAGEDPEYCVPDSGFTAQIDLSGVPPGAHWLQIVATDYHLFPMPTSFQRQFVAVPSPPNGSPVAVDDHYIASVGVGGPNPEILDPLDNDSDPEGDLIRLADDPIVVPPFHGTVERLNDYQLRYTPFAHDSGRDTLIYRIVDPSGNTATAEIEVRVMEVLVP